MPVLGALDNFISNAAKDPAAFIASAVREVRFESNLTPPLRIAAPLAGGQADSGDGSGGPGLLLWLLAPRVSVQLGAGDPLVFAPGGAPNPDLWPVGAAALVLLLGLAGYGLYALATR